MYKKNNKWNAHGRNCFVKPLPVKDSFLKKRGKYEPLMGTVKYINKELAVFGVEEGDEVSFQPESEYEFRVDGEVLYRLEAIRKMNVEPITMGYGSLPMGGGLTWDIIADGYKDSY